MSTIESGSVAATTYRAMAESESEYRLLSIRLQAQRDALLAAAKVIDAGPWLPICKEREQLRQAIAACEKP